MRQPGRWEAINPRVQRNCHLIWFIIVDFLYRVQALVGSHKNCPMYGQRLSVKFPESDRTSCSGLNYELDPKVARSG